MSDLLGFPPGKVPVVEHEFPIPNRVKVTVLIGTGQFVYSTPLPDKPTGDDLVRAVSELCVEIINDHGFVVKMEEN